MAENREPFALDKKCDSEELSFVKNESKGRRNIAKRNVSRMKNRVPKSPKIRASTPEPEQRIFTDDSEKDVSDSDCLSSVSAGRSEVKSRGSGAKKFNFGLKNHFGRSKSLDRSSTKDTESEEDFETIRKRHRDKEMEEDRKEAEKLIENSKPKTKEGLKEHITKEMPPLIIAPKDSSKRKRHKSLPQEYRTEAKMPQPKLDQTKRNLLETKSEDLCDFTDSNKFSEIQNTDSNSELKMRKSRKSESGKLLSGDETEKLITKKEHKAEDSQQKQWFLKKWFLKIVSNKQNIESTETIKQSTDVKSRKEILKGESPKRNWIIVEIVREWKAHVRENHDYYSNCKKLKNRCIADLIILLLFCGFGGLVFRFTEGAFESFYKCGVKRVKRDFIENLWKYSQYMLEEDWKSQARRRLMEFEIQLHSAHEAGMTTYSGQKSWSFLNAVVYCLTIVTTIGYGHISPSTTTGRAITIIYAIFGIPMFLILLADFGKLFTRGIKFVWAFVRRLYYTGSCRRVRKTVPVQEMMKSVQIMYDFAKTRKFSVTTGMESHDQHLSPPRTNLQNTPESPGTPRWSAFEIDDEFNLPISVAISILLTYIFFGAFLYWMWEDWTFFESFYFVFISMSTIGFGDFVPQHPIYMMLSIIYLIFGLALTSMCINVVQEKLSDTFRQASVKLGTTIGLTVEEPVLVTEELNPEINEPQQI